MDLRRWRDATRIFARALERNEEERERILDEECGEDAALRSLVQRMIASDEDPDTVLNAGPDRWLDEADEPPRALGAYTIVGEVGRGGMGTVLLGRRADGRFDRNVAIKMISRGFDSHEVRSRFESETRILAGLEHPGIARLYDAGVDDGRPFLVMEYVEGRRIDRFADAATLGVEARLRLFRQVCGAVEFAHRNLVIHRDLKPSNILVDAEGRVKLLDFGIARLVEPGSEDAPTRAAFTPEYASPEQLRGASLSTVSDVYALGIVLYELLTGRRPGESRPGDLAAAVARAGSVPDAPSTVITREFETRDHDGTPRTVTPDDVARTRRASAEQLRRTLKGDIDHIVLKALRPDPEDRYASVGALSEDVGRYLDGLPVSARKGSFGYRAQRFVQRHRWGVAAAVAAILTLLAVSVAALEQARTARAERDSAEDAFAFLEDLLTSPDPFREAGVRGDSVLLVDFIDRAAERIDAELTDPPRARARMLTTLGRVYVNLGRAADARPVLEEALAAGRMAGEAEQLAEAQMALAVALDVLGEREEGERLLLEALATLEEAGSAGTEQTADAQELLGRAYMDSRRLDEAEVPLEAAYRTRLALFGDTSEAVGRSLNALASVATLRGDHERGIDRFEESAAVYRRAGLAEHPDYGIILANLSRSYVLTGRLSSADSAATEATRVIAAALGPEHLMHAGTMARLADIRAALGRPEEADSLYRTATATLNRVAPDNVMSIVPLGNYASFLLDQGRLEEAEAMALEATARAERVLGEGHPLHAGGLQRLGSVARARGEPERAAELQGRAVAALERALGPDHPQTLSATLSLARSVADLGRTEEAIDMVERTRDVASGARGQDDPAVRGAEELLAELRARPPTG